MLSSVRPRGQERGRNIHLLLSVLLLGALLAIAGCNTMRGAGQDVEAAGGAMSDTAEDVQDEM